MRVALLLALGLSGCSTLNLGEPIGEVDTAAPNSALVRVWEEAAGAAFGPSAAVVTQEFVVMGTRQGEIVIMESMTGRVRGSVSVGESIEGQFAVSENGRTVYAPTAEVRGGVVAYNVATGARVWRWREGGVQGGVVRVGDRLVTSTLTGDTVGLDAETGEELWRTAGTPAAQVHAAPVVVGSSVAVVNDRGRVVVYDPASGAERWTAEVGAPVYATPMVQGDLYVATTRGRVARLGAASGEVVWAVDTEQTLRAASPLVVDGRVVVGFSDGTVRSLDQDTGDEQWRTDVGSVVSARPAASDGQIWVGTMGNRLIALDAETGAQTWSAELRGRVKSDIVVGGGRVFAFVEPGHVVAFGSQP